MGKRKERKLAAKIGAGRRVKLDLFAEPSGDLDSSFAKDEDGKDVDTKPDRELSKSPLSSGQPPENPLSLLGQYSDDDLDDGANETATNSDGDKQAKNTVEPLEEGEIVGVEDHSSHKADNLDVESDSSVVSASVIAEPDGGKNDMVRLNKEDHVVSLENHVASDSKTIVGLSSTWKMVLHEESNQYYYWNTVTGETSWEVPDSLAQGTELTDKHESLGAEMIETAASDVNAPANSEVTSVEFSASQVVGCTIADMKAIYGPATLVNQSLEHSEVGNQFHGGFSVVDVGALPYEASSFGHYPLSMQVNAGSGSLVAASYQEHDLNSFSSEQGAVDLPSQLLKNGEILLERLKLLQGSGVESTGHGWLSRYILEIEIRLSDIRFLLPYGPSLVPFWVHSERQLNRLENAINTEIGEQHNKVSALHVSAEEGKETNLEIGTDAKVDANMQKFPKNLITTEHDVDTSATVQKAVSDRSSDEGILNVKQTSLEDAPVYQHSENKGEEEIRETAVHGEASTNPEFHSSEDMDMDIDMEIEDQSPAVKSVVDIGGQLVAPSEQLVQPNAPTAGISLTPESEFIIPPPPEEEWIPPPPPDEGIPPPPPDEPPESLSPPPPPPEPEPVPSIYSELHNSMCIGPTVNYYGSTSAGSLGTSFYERADVSQIAALTPPAYYAGISNAQATSVLNSPDSAVFYGVPNGVLPVVPVPSTMESFNFQAVSGHPNYDPSLEHVETVGAVARGSSLSKQFMDPLVSKTDIAQTQVSSDSVISAPATSDSVISAPATSDSVISAPATESTKENASVPCYSSTAMPITRSTTSVAASGASTSVSKLQSKASRMKKPKVAVASSLRSNKKVSSLVDKWKAAKEELQEEEKQERETPLEVLEKKKQREIEGWRAQQIASGEAKENANFQPLGGDWRERVKRKRAQKEAAAGTTSGAVHNEMKKPDLSELARDLPPGWQAYWDDSSKQVYYANLVTSETTWSKPTR